MMMLMMLIQIIILKHTKNKKLRILNYFSGRVKAIDFKVGLSPSQKICFICFNESHSKIMKNAFLLYLRSFFSSQDS